MLEYTSQGNRLYSTMRDGDRGHAVVGAAIISLPWGRQGIPSRDSHLNRFPLALPKSLRMKFFLASGLRSYNFIYYKRILWWAIVIPKGSRQKRLASFHLHFMRSRPRPYPPRVRHSCASWLSSSHYYACNVDVSVA